MNTTTKKSSLLAITLSLSGKDYKKILQSWNILKNKYNIKFISSRSPKPHITIISGYIKNLSLIKKKIRRIYFKRFILRSAGLGVFLMENPLIYIRWEKNLYLTKLYELVDKNFNEKIFKKTKFSGSFYWVPKTTIAYKDFKIKNLDKIFKSLKKISKPLSVKVDKIELMSASIKHGEKIIFSKLLY